MSAFEMSHRGANRAKTLPKTPQKTPKMSSSEISIDNCRVSGGCSDLALGFFSNVICELSQRLGSPNTDTARDASSAQNAVTDNAGALGGVGNAVQADEALVDAVDLLLWSKACHQAHHALRHVSIQREVGRQSYKAVTLLEVTKLKIRLPHFDAQRLGFIATSNSAAIVLCSKLRLERAATTA